MKYIVIIVLALVGAASVSGQTPLCHDEMICTGVNGCRWVTFCKSAPTWTPMPPPTPTPPMPLPAPAAPPRLPLCHDEMICTGVNGCRWVTFCN